MPVIFAAIPQLFFGPRNINHPAHAEPVGKHPKQITSDRASAVAAAAQRGLLALDELD